ncbi:MAG: c-type cytochrome [Magnetococcales bacterium]|nr:c-type cytochrome [Magnetococcales bacterium]
MLGRSVWFGVMAVFLGGMATGCSQKSPASSGLHYIDGSVGQVQASLARGGRLYDKWYKEIEAPAPKVSHSAYPTTAKYAEKPRANWRCKECHGWDYRGKEGAYASGKHFSGIKGISELAGESPERIIGILKDGTHQLDGKMSDVDFRDLANFVSAGQVDMDLYIDRESKKAHGDVERGEAYYQTVCANCHGADGTKIEKMPAMGKVANGNPWETLHKILNGQPLEEMPALRAMGREMPLASGMRVPADILAYTQTLPSKKPGK